MPLSKDQALSIADELIEDAKKRRRAEQRELAGQPALWYRVGIPELAAFSLSDRVMLVERAKKRTRRNLLIKVAWLAMVIVNFGSAVAWFTGWVKPYVGAVWITGAIWFHLLLLGVLYVWITRKNMQKIARATLEAGELSRLQQHSTHQ